MRILRMLANQSEPRQSWSGLIGLLSKSPQCSKIVGVKLLSCVLIAAGAVLAQSARPVQELSTSAGVVKITPINHASLMIEGGGKVIHIDPTSPGNYDGLPAADIVLITDIHGDHMDPKALPKVQKAGTVILAPEAVAKTFTTATVIGNGYVLTYGGKRIYISGDTEGIPEMKALKNIDM